MTSTRCDGSSTESRDCEVCILGWLECRELGTGHYRYANSSAGRSLRAG
jgi:hypothetical protein